MKDEVKLADILEALVQRLDEDLDQVEDSQFGLRTVDAKHEVEGRVVTVDQPVVGATN